jgi:hypothetical protein
MNNGKKEQRIKERIDPGFIKGVSAISFHGKVERHSEEEQTKIHEWGVEVVEAERPRQRIKSYAPIKLQ